MCMNPMNPLTLCTVAVFHDQVKNQNSLKKKKKQEHKLKVKITPTHIILHQLNLKHQSKVSDLMVNSERSRNSILMGRWIRFSLPGSETYKYCKIQSLLSLAKYDWTIFFSARWHCIYKCHSYKTEFAKFYRLRGLGQSPNLRQHGNTHSVLMEDATTKR